VLKRTFHPTTGHEGEIGEYKYRSTLSLTSALDCGGEWLTTPQLYPPGKRDGTRCTGGWMGHGVGLDVRGKSRHAPTGIRSMDLPACSESLNLLSYPGSLHVLWG